MSGSTIPLGKGPTEVGLLTALANRHGLIAGATGTGKTVTLQTLAQGLSQAGVPVFLADVKGDLSSIARPGRTNGKLAEAAAGLGRPIEPMGCPTIFWDVFGEQGHPVRTTISEMGPLLLSRLMDLNATQEGVLNVAFRLADDQGLMLLDLKDLRAILQFVSANAKEIQSTYGNVSAASVGAIQRQLLILEGEGADRFFGEPALALSDLMRVDDAGQGVVSVLAADKLMRNPRMYATLLLWLLSELFEELPEAGDLDRPKLAFFFDEAHLLFNDAPAALVQKVEGVVRLIRSKGVGVYFVTQNPLDVPETVLGQLGNRVQHALRAYTPRDQKAVRAAAETFRQNPEFDTQTVITELGIGEALVSVLDEKGAPTVVERVRIYPPFSQVGPLDPAERLAIAQADPVGRKYSEPLDRESAFELLETRARRDAMQAEELASHEAMMKEREKALKAQERAYSAPGYGAPRRRAEPASGMEKVLGAAAQSAMRSAGSQLGRSVMRGVLGGLFRGR